jgi:carbamate kinase
MKSEAKKEILLVALGGNALIRKGQVGTVEEQFQNIKVPIHQIARLSRQYSILITHGNAPQVGNLLLQQECSNDVPDLPLEILVAQTQGQIGYMIESTLDAQLMELGIHTGQRLVSLISYVVVDENDPAFQDPSKPIGPIFTPEKAHHLPYPTRETAKGYRRVVASPKPLTIVEKRELFREWTLSSIKTWPVPSSLRKWGWTFFSLQPTWRVLPRILGNRTRSSFAL